jgi:hypothetical protein
LPLLCRHAQRHELQVGQALTFDRLWTSSSGCFFGGIEDLTALPISYAKAFSDMLLAPMEVKWQRYQACLASSLMAETHTCAP